MASEQKAYSDYGIPVFYDNRNGEMILRDTKEFFEGEHSVSDEVWKDKLLKLRGEISLNKTFLCGHCQRPIYISGRYEPVAGQKRLHFQHFRYSDGEECAFHEGSHYTQDEIRRMIFNGRQESREHKKLKRIIQDCFIPIVGENHVFEEPTLHGNDGGWRRPDIYVELSDKNIVFEVQLTYIFLTVINERNIVHRNNDRYVMWIFRDFGNGDGEKTIESERLSKLDIFAANNYNAFVLDEEAIEETQLMGELYLNVYYRDYYINNGRSEALLKKSLVAFDDLIFDNENKLIYYFDSEAKLKNCDDEIAEQRAKERMAAIQQERERLKAEEANRKLEEEKKQAEIERKREADERAKLRHWERYGIIEKLFHSAILPSEKMDAMVKMAKEDFEFLHDSLEYIYNFTANHRRDNSSVHSLEYQNSINYLTALYDDFASKGKPNVMTCLKRCWENLSDSAKYPGGKDYTVDVLFSPSLSNINFKFFEFLFSPNHNLTSDQKNRIQKWLTDYHNSSNAGKYGKDRYRHFYSWMVILNDKVRKVGTLPITEAHALMRNKYKIIRGLISLRFGFLSGYNNDYRSLYDVCNAFENDFPEYAGLACYVMEKHVGSIYIKLSQVAATMQQKHDLDELIKILFTKSDCLRRDI